jgi:hypothetical protein
MTPVLIAALGIAVFGPAVLMRWRRGLPLLLVFMPFAGLLTLSLHPAVLPKIYKDLFFVLPMYLGVLALCKIPLDRVRLPGPLVLSLLAFACLVLLQMANPAIPNPLVAVIGARVWLFYVPLLLVAMLWVRGRRDLHTLLRLMAVLAVAPCLLGLAEWASCILFGYQETMYALYGEAAPGATQQFAVFVYGSTFYRIPSTFTFVAQYFGYTMSMVVPAYALWKTDPDRRWRRFGALVLGLVVVASFLSGARTAFVFVPLLLFTAYLLNGRFLATLRAAGILAACFFVVLSVVGVDPFEMAYWLFWLLKHYGKEIVFTGFYEALATAPLGTGTGMNTGAARYAFASQEITAFENFYAKAIFEMGVPGLLALLAVFGSLLHYGFKSLRETAPAYRGAAAMLLAFLAVMMLNSLKGWQLDMDPINVYFWFFAGLLLRLRTLEPPPRAEAAP